MYSGFQSNAFQRDAFQIVGGGEEPAVVTQNGAGFPAWDSTGYLKGYDKRRVSDRVDMLADRIDQLPDIVQDAIEDSLNIDKPADRTRHLQSKLAGVERQFQRLYASLMESYRQAWLDQQLAIELERQRDEEEAILMLLLD